MPSITHLYVLIKTLRLRCECDGVLIGRTTAEVDDPSLTVRRVECNNPQPIRVVLDPDLTLVQQEMRNDYALFNDGLAPTIVYHCVKDVDDTILDLEESVTCVYLPSSSSSPSSPPRKNQLSLEDVVHNLSERFHVKHLLVEGGPVTARNFLKQPDLVDRAIIIKAPLCFRQPLESGITDSVLEASGLIKLGSEPCGVDQVEYWSRGGLQSWPTKSLSDWP